jgi:hypothetical protein
MKSTITVAALAIMLAMLGLSGHISAGADAEAWTSAPAASSVMNFGVDIKPDETFTQVGFYDGQPAKGGNDGAMLNSTDNKEMEFTISTPGLSSGRATAFNSSSTAKTFRARICSTSTSLNSGQGYVRYFSPGYPGARALVPVEAGPLEASVVTPYATDRNPNAFMLSQPPATPQDGAIAPLSALADEIASGSLKDRIVAAEKVKKQKISGRFDGANLPVKLITP